MVYKYGFTHQTPDLFKEKILGAAGPEIITILIPRTLDTD